MAEIKRLILDNDDVIFDCRQAYCDVYNQKYKQHKDFRPALREKMFTWDLQDECPLEKDIYSILSSKEYFECVKFMDGAYEVIRELSERIPIMICSTCSYTTMGDKALVIKEKLPFIKDTIFITDSKTLNKGIVDMSGCIFVDDSAKNLKLSNAEVKICFGAIHEQNQGWNGLWEKNWQDLRKTILEYI